MKKVIPANSILIPDNAELVYEGIFYSTYHWPQTLFDGSTSTFEMLKRRDTAVIIGIVEDKLIVIEEDQPHSGKRTTFPAGSVESSDESLQFAAEREMLEETGYTFNNWRLIKVVQPANDIEWFVHIWLAMDVKSKSEQAPDPGEKISVILKDFNEIKAMITQDQGVLGENKDIFQELNITSDLVNLPEFSGLSVDR